MRDDEGADHFPDDFPDPEPDDVPDEEPDYVTDYVPDHIADEEPDDVPDHIPDDVPDRVPDPEVPRDELHELGLRGLVRVLRRGRRGDVRKPTRVPGRRRRLVRVLPGRR